MKEFILDIQVVLNSTTLINLEMQVVNKINWPERSLSYLCRRFDQLGKGAWNVEREQLLAKLAEYEARDASNA